MRPISAVTAFIQDLSYLVDKGLIHSIEEVNNHIENKDVFDWLEKQYPFRSKNGLDLSLFEQEDRDFIQNELESYWGGYAGEERRKWGITQNGLCLLISWSIEIVRDLCKRV